MTTLSPEAMLKHTEKLAKNLRLAESKEIAVGLPKSAPSTRKIYKKGKKKGKSVLEIGIIHEYGLGNNPVRSFLRVPFKKNQDRIVKVLDISYQKIANGEEVIKQMNRAAAFIRDISHEAFKTRGYGTWKDITQQTKDAKGSSAILIDTGTLRNSITYVVRNAAA